MCSVHFIFRRMSHNKDSCEVFKFSSQNRRFFSCHHSTAGFCVFSTKGTHLSCRVSLDRAMETGRGPEMRPEEAPRCRRTNRYGLIRKAGRIKLRSHHWCLQRDVPDPTEFHRVLTWSGISGKPGKLRRSFPVRENSGKMAILAKIWKSGK